MNLVCCGISHRSSTVAEREKFQLSKSELSEAVVKMRRISGAEEVAVLATCNRVEFYFSHNQKVDPRDWVNEFYADLETGMPLVNDQWYVRQQTSVARHLFKITAGLDSPLLGETQVLGQVKNAYSAACTVDGPKTILHKLFHLAFQISKKIHSETEIGLGPQGQAGAALDLVHQVVGSSLEGKKVVIVGVNSSAEMLLPRLTREGAQTVIVNRTLSTAEKLGHPYKIDSLPLTVIGDVLIDADVIFSLTASTDYVISLQHFSQVDPNRPLLAIDLAIPHDIDPEVKSIPGVTLFDLDDIKRHLGQTTKERTTELPYALQLVDEQVVVYESWRKLLYSNNHEDLRDLIEKDRRAILDRFKDSFRQSELKALDTLSHTLCKQFIRRLNNSSVQE